MRKVILYLAVAACVVACKPSEADKDLRSEGEEMLAAPQEPAKVDTVGLHKKPFSGDVVSNGHVRAGRWADLNFRNSGIVSEVNVREGQHVAKGQALARLDTYRLESDRIRQEAALEQARLDMQDVLIGQGYNPDDLTSVPQEVVRIARIKSGLTRAEAEYNATLRDLAEATLTAPFDGVVANVAARPHSMTPSDPVCRVISKADMTVEFPILENEIALMTPGVEIDVTPYTGGETHSGRITDINPQVDETGHVRVTARLDGASGLLDGMNVRIRARRDLGARLSVPKSAVVLRTGRQVVFTYENGRAIWNYVKTGLENLDSYEITEGLEEGAAVIVSGNENLAHESPVKL